MTSLYDFLKANGESSDVYDTVFDLGVCWDLPDPNDRSDWAKVSRFMLKNIRYVRGTPPYGVVADKYGFVREHVSEMRKITSLFYNERYQVRGTDDDSLYVGVELLDDLQIGNFPDAGYADVIRIFGIGTKAKKSSEAKSRTKTKSCSPKTEKSVRTHGRAKR